MNETKKGFIQLHLSVLLAGLEATVCIYRQSDVQP